MSSVMLNKRKRQEVEDSDEDEPTLGRQVLPVANLPADFSGEPEDGLQYLFVVRRDSRALPHTTRVTNPYEINEQTQQVVDLTEPTSDRIPSEEWRELFLYRFKNFRQNCTQPTVHINIPPRPTYKIMPDRKEREHWWAFLNGRPETEWNPPKKPKKQNNRNDRYGAGPSRVNSRPYGRDEVDVLDYAVSMDPTESLPTPSGTPAPPDQKVDVRPLEDVPAHAQGSPMVTGLSTAPAVPQPTPSLMRDINHAYAIHLLMYFAHWINLHLEDEVPQESQLQYVVTETHAKWMFVLLARVDDFISADEMSTLRSLARGCLGLIKLRMQQRGSTIAIGDVSGMRDTFSATTSAEVISETSCWMIVTAIIGLWAQRDLWQDAEDMLAKTTAQLA
ncbi:hypothetical protein BDY19DRAFT_944290 [Irpex rosettiformis]|uniref:Uncharacterized protein n=1 Tax=Irpex rosettiformis TaxID=378272 RepID=A0ACB8U589_9APHY|nr:hypothetical protein BDY19DRAFT_944290 [Irpex rosettiformis]